MTRAFFTVLIRSSIGLLGVMLTTASAILFISLLVIEGLGAHSTPYTGIIAFAVLPTLLAVGLVLIPIGVWRVRRADRALGVEGDAVRAPVIDFNVPRTRGMAVLVAALTVVNIVILATGTYKAVEVMESTEFCGGACHTVMEPEFSTHARSPHARVSCTQCHVGSGAEWFVKSKLEGSWQLIAVAFDLYPRPIPTPVETLRPARETCEQCHWPTRFVGERLKVITRFEEDEANTAKKTVLMMKVGGELGGKARGVHWHVDPKNRVRFRADRTRQYVHEVEMSLADGTKRHYTNERAAPQGSVLSDEWRTMDCLDCHNRPTHSYQRPKDAVDQGLASGALDASLPFIRREGLRVLQLPWASAQEAEQGMRRELQAFYAKEAPQVVERTPEKIDAAAVALATMFKHNVFPAMKVGWNTYPTFRDHEDDGGCFRCHSSDLKTAEGAKISQKCDLCHNTLAENEENPEILVELFGD